ncbi:MAG: hypothetical protein PHH08_02740 [Candidatus ainarchaeum sp.]|nr:hypothetical protein [Candidatus ainarchaeum sp.]
MENKGFFFSLEAVLALAMVSGLLLMQVPEEKKDLHELVVFQKENDLLKIWAKQRSFIPEKMKKDFEFAFPETGGEIKVNGKATAIGKKTGRAVSSETGFFGLQLEKTTVSISVFE